MNTYEDMKKALIKLCRNEKLIFREASFEDGAVIFERRDNSIILNRDTECLLHKGGAER